jgi:hypothetical protein
MPLTDAIINDIQKYYHLSRVVKRYEAQGKPLESYEYQVFIDCKNRLLDLYEFTGLNMITVCDEGLVNEWLKFNTTLAVAFIPHRNVCCLSIMAYTVAIMYNIDEHGYQARYCYHTLVEASEAFNTWSGQGHPPGNWIKRKGDGRDISNPNYVPASNHTS